MTASEMKRIAELIRTSANAYEGAVLEAINNLALPEDVERQAATSATDVFMSSRNLIKAMENTDEYTT